MFGVEMSQVFGKESHLFNASVFGYYSLVLFVPKIYSPFAAGGVYKVLPVPLNLSVFVQRRYWTLFLYFHSWSTGGWLQFSDLGHRSNGSVHEFLRSGMWYFYYLVTHTSYQLLVAAPSFVAVLLHSKWSRKLNWWLSPAPRVALGWSGRPSSFFGQYREAMSLMKRMCSSQRRKWNSHSDSTHFQAPGIVVKGGFESVLLMFLFSRVH